MDPLSFYSPDDRKGPISGTKKRENEIFMGNIYTRTCRQNKWKLIFSIRQIGLEDHKTLRLRYKMKQKRLQFFIKN